MAQPQLVFVFTNGDLVFVFTNGRLVDKLEGGAGEAFIGWHEESESEGEI
jgi:hypothetical protein